MLFSSVRNTFATNRFPSKNKSQLLYSFYNDVISTFNCLYFQCSLLKDCELYVNIMEYGVGYASLPSIMAYGKEL